MYVGANADALAAGLGEHGATTVYAVDPGDALPGVVGAAALETLMAEHKPDVVLFAQSYDGRDALSRLSVKLDRPVLTNGTSLRVDGDKVIVGAAIFGGNTLVDTEFEGEAPFLAAIRPKSFAAEPSGGGPAAVVAVSPSDAGRAGEAKVLERHVEEREGPKLEEATVVVSGGRGLGSAEAYEPLVEQLAKLLGGASGASRAIVDAGVGALLEAGGPDRQGREAEGVHRPRHLRGDPAHGGDEGLREHHRREQGRRGADLRHRGPRRGR